MKILIPEGWNDYELLDSGKGRRLERFGRYTLNRPDPQAIWTPRRSESEWEKADYTFTTRWEGKTPLPEKWEVTYNDLRFYARLTPFKHTGIFPEQAANWNWMREKISNDQCKILNLFGYTGAASLACAAEGAIVTHVDASRPAISWARENQERSGLAEKPIRWILDDALKFCEREVRRENHYDGIIMDPPIYGHGPTGEKWDFFESVPRLLDVCQQLLSDTPLFVLINAYAITASAIMLENLLEDMMKKYPGEIESGELVLQESESKRFLSTGIFARWSK